MIILSTLLKHTRLSHKFIVFLCHFKSFFWWPKDSLQPSMKLIIPLEGKIFSSKSKIRKIIENLVDNFSTLNFSLLFFIFTLQNKPTSLSSPVKLYKTIWLSSTETVEHNNLWLAKESKILSINHMIWKYSTNILFFYCKWQWIEMILWNIF